MAVLAVTQVSRKCMLETTVHTSKRDPLHSPVLIPEPSKPRTDGKNMSVHQQHDVCTWWSITTSTECGLTHTKPTLSHGSFYIRNNGSAGNLLPSSRFLRFVPSKT